MNTNRAKPLRVVCLLARAWGVEVLRALVQDERFRVCALLVHSRLPKNEDPQRGLRPEFSLFKRIAEEHSIPLGTVDSREEAQELSPLEGIGGFDFLISVSWRFLVPEVILDKARIGAVNAHRGRLPTYAGAEPVRRALENGEREVVLTVHEMTEKIDSGRVLVEKIHPVVLNRSQPLEENVERIKKELIPLYPQAVIEGVKKLWDEWKNKGALSSAKL